MTRPLPDICVVCGKPAVVGLGISDNPTEAYCQLHFEGEMVKVAELLLKFKGLLK